MSDEIAWGIKDIESNLINPVKGPEIKGGCGVGNYIKTK